MKRVLVLGIALGSAVAQGDGDPLGMAQQAYVEGHYQQARDLARQGMAKNPAVAWRIVGTASCNLKDRPGVIEAMGRVPKGDVELVRFACKKAGVEITDDEAAMWQSPAREEVERAQAAYDASKWAEAKKQALAATTKDPKLALGWRVLGAASCWMKDKGTAQKASEHLQPVDQEYVRAVCARAIGVQLKNSRVLR
jgi:hypothetical protein